MAPLGVITMSDGMEYAQGVIHRALPKRENRPGTFTWSSSPKTTITN